MGDRITIPEEVIEFFENQGNCVYANNSGNAYYCYPFWLKKHGGNKGYEVLLLNNIPDELIELIGGEDHASFPRRDKVDLLDYYMGHAPSVPDWFKTPQISVEDRFFEWRKFYAERMLKERIK